WHYLPMLVLGCLGQVVPEWVMAACGSLPPAIVPTKVTSPGDPPLRPESYVPNTTATVRRTHPRHNAILQPRPRRGIQICDPARLEVRVFGRRHIGVLSRVPLDVFGASLFLPVSGPSTASISHGRGPRRGEDAFILDCELEL